MAATTNGDALRLPFPDDTFDRIIASEVLEHVPDDQVALDELFRVLKPGGTLAVTVPSWLPEQICWALSDEYHAPFVEGGHVRIYTEPELRARMRDAGLRARRRPPRPRPALAVLVAEVRGRPHQRRPPAREGLPPGPLWDIAQTQPMGTVTRLAERVLNPVLGKSLVVYARKPGGTA